jgi:hypothetical protein
MNRPIVNGEDGRALEGSGRLKFAEFFFGPHEKNVCISHAVKQGKLIRAKRESGYAKREVALRR